MGTIQNFREIRRDGKVIDESMAVQEILALGATEKIIEVQWSDGSQSISLQASHGVLAKVVPGGQFVAANEREDESGQHRRLLVINADGSRHLEVPNIHNIRGKDEPGQFCWFEPPRIDAPNVFGVVFSCASDNSMYQLDIDATTGKVVGTYPIR